MGMLGKMFGKRSEAAKVAADRFDKKDLVEACIAGAILIAFADGECEESEMAALTSIIQANDSFKNFSSEVPILVDKYAGLMRAGKTLGRIKLLRELDDVKASQDEKEEVLATMISIAEADGEIEPQELKELKEVGRRLGVNVEAMIA